MAICHSLGIGETKTYSPGFGFGFRGISGSFISDLKSIRDFSFIENIFFDVFFQNQKNNKIFMIRNDKILGN